MKLKIIKSRQSFKSRSFTLIFNLNPFLIHFTFIISVCTTENHIYIDYLSILIIYNVIFSAAAAIFPAFMWVKVLIIQVMPFAFIYVFSLHFNISIWLFFIVNDTISMQRYTIAKKIVKA